MDLLDFAQAVTDGVLFGATYALIGIGFTLIFGVMQKLNLAYAAVAIAGAYISIAFGAAISIGFGVVICPPVIFLVAGLASGVVGYLVYLCSFRFIPLTNPLATLMATVGALILIDEIIVHATIGLPQPYPALFFDVYLEWGDFGLRGDLMFIFFLSLVAMVVLMYVLYRTRLGIATRAVAQQPVAAQLAGISIERTNALTFVITGVLGGLAGAMIGAAVGVLSSTLLIFPITIKGLIVAVIGGLGSIPGAIVAGLFLGAFENFFLAWRGVTERDMWVMALLFFFLTVRPGGIFSPAASRD